MQLAGNTALATALATGQKRYFSVNLMFDWDHNGLYANANSNLSNLFVDATIDRQLSGSFPDELEITDGYVAAQLDLTLEGYLADGVTPVWQAFSPYSGNPLGTIGALNVPMYLELVVATSAGPVAIRQFTGYVSDGLPSRADGKVTITCYDAAAILINPVTLLPWAVDGFTRTQFTSNPDTPDSGTVALSWVLENILRLSGWYQGPAWHPNVVAAWTLAGSALPEIGTTGIEDPFVNGVWSFGYGEYNIPQFSPSGSVASVYGPGKFGSCAFKGATKLPALTGRGITYLYGNAHVEWGQQQVFNVASYGSANSNLLGFGGWYNIDPTQSGSSTMTCWLEEAHYNFSSGSTTDRNPAYVQVAVNHATGAISATAINEGATTTWTFTSGTAVTAGWHYVNFVFVFTSTSITCHFLIDGVSVATSTGGVAAAIGTFTYSNAVSNTNLCQIIARGPVQYAQIYLQANTAYASATPPPMNPTGTQITNLGQSLTRLLWMPSVQQAPAWDSLKAPASAENGALYVTESGVVTFDNRSTIKSRQLAANSVLTLTLDQVQDIQPQSTLSSLINTMPYTVHGQHAESYSTTFKTSQPTDYQIPANSTQVWGVATTNAQSVRVGNVSWHPQAQGYANPSAPGEAGGAGPSGGFTFRDWMNIYGPGFWNDGFTAYAPGSTDPSNQPIEGTGLNAIIYIGWGSLDQDARRIRLTLANTNTSGGLLEFAVNDATPFLHVGGTIIVDDGSSTFTYFDSPSVGQYGSRTLSYPSSDWVQDATSVATVVTSIVNDTKQPKAYFQSIDIVGDPRLQLQDVVTVTDPTGMGATMPASVYGINRKISLTDGVADSLTLRTF